MTSSIILVVAAGLSLAIPGHPVWSGRTGMPVEPVRLSCKSVSSCEEAVMLWCSGYDRADGDGDGIPCETVCSSRAEVEAIIASQGC